MWRSALRIITAIFFVAAGLNHFVHAEIYLRIMPPSFAYPLGLVWISGVCEIIGGSGLLIPTLRRWASWGLILLLIAVFPANIYMAINADHFAQFPRWGLLARLPIQPLLMWWVWWLGRQ